MKKIVVNEFASNAPGKAPTVNHVGLSLKLFMKGKNWSKRVSSYDHGHIDSSFIDGMETLLYMSYNGLGRAAPQLLPFSSCTSVNASNQQNRSLAQ